jgi:hypothetical protein
MNDELLNGQDDAAIAYFFKYINILVNIAHCLKYVWYIQNSGSLI